MNRGWQSQEGKRLPDGRIVNRPSSQPTGHRNPRDKDGRAILGNPDRIRHFQDARKRYIELEQGGGLEKKKLGDKGPFDNERSQGYGHQAPDSNGTRIEAQISPKQERLAEPDYSLLGRATQIPSQYPDQRIESGHTRAKQTLERDSQPQSTVQSPFSPETLRRLQKERHRNQSQSPSKHARALTRADERVPQTLPEDLAPFPGTMEIPKGIDTTDQNPFREDLNGHRKSSLAMLIEANRRGGRFSPLPQAVQGAQGRTSGPASDPGIKNEFARMFSGIGSGVGSAGPTGSGTSTPFAPPSPTTSHEQRPTPFSARGELGSGKPATASRGGKRSRKARDEESKAELVDGEAASAKPMKRSRQNHHHSHLVHQ